MGANRRPGPFLQGGVGADMVFVAVGVDDLLDRCVLQCGEQFPHRERATRVDQQAVDPVGGRKVDRPSEECAGQTKPAYRPHVFCENHPASAPVGYPMDLKPWDCGFPLDMEDAPM